MAGFWWALAVVWWTSAPCPLVASTCSQFLSTLTAKQTSLLAQVPSELNCVANKQTEALELVFPLSPSSVRSEQKQRVETSTASPNSTDETSPNSTDQSSQNSTDHSMLETSEGAFRTAQQPITTATPEFTSPSAPPAPPVPPAPPLPPAPPAPPLPGQDPDKVLGPPTPEEELAVLEDIYANAFPGALAWNLSDGNPCSWFGVACVSPSNGSVSRLNLVRVGLTALPRSIGALQHLFFLSVNHNGLESLPSQIGLLSSLEELNIEGNRFQELPSELRRLQTLRAINIGATFFHTFPTILNDLPLDFLACDRCLIQDFSGLYSVTLQTLRITRCSVEFVPGSLFQMPSLQSLTISRCSKLSSLGGPTNLDGPLEDLYVPDNALRSIPPSLLQLRSLQYALLANNAITALPPTLSSSLRIITATTNLITDIPSTYLQHNLLHLALDNNLITTIPHLLGHQLTLLSVSNNLVEFLPTQLGMTSLKDLHFQGNQVSHIPTEIGNVESLVALGASENILTSLPTELGNCKYLAVLQLASNRLETIPSQLARLSQLDSLSLTDNRLTEVPDELDVLAPNLAYLYLSVNRLKAFTPGVVRLITNCCFEISFASNRITGTLPKAILEHHPNGRELRGTLDFSDNLLSGTIEGYLPCIRCVFDHNLFSGTVSATLHGPLSEVIRLADNQLCGTLPRFTNCPKLEQLDISGNRFRGTLPLFTQPITHLDFSHNVFEDQVRSEFFLSVSDTLQFAILSHNKLYGTLPWNIVSATRMRELNLGHNPFNSSLAEFAQSLLVSFGSHVLGCVGCSSLSILNLERAQLWGTIPNTFGLLNTLQVLSLRGTQVSGTVPQFYGGDTLHLSSYFSEAVFVAPPRWIFFDIADTMVHGPIPEEWGRMRELKFADVSSTNLQSSDGALPRFVIATSARRAFQRATAADLLSTQCPTPVRGVESSISLTLHPSYYNFSLCICSAGAYGLHGICRVCPPGGVCPGGSNPSKSLRAGPGRWCDPERFYGEQMIEQCYSCPSYQCCSNPTSCALNEQCALRRKGVLCGQCEPRYAAVIGSPVCMPDKGCNAAAWLIPVSVIATALVVFGLLAVSGKPSPSVNSLSCKASAMISVAVFFYQMVPLFLGTRAIRRLQQVFAVILALVSINPNATSRSDGGICVFPGLTNVERELLAYGIPALLAGWLLVYTLATAVHNWRASRQRLRDVTARNYAAVVGASLILAEFSYSAIVKTTFSLLQCESVHGQRVLFIAGHVSCYRNWQIVLAVLSPLLAAFPIWTGWLAMKACQTRSAEANAAWGVLSATFKKDHRWYYAAPLFIRLVSFVIDVFANTPTEAAVGLTIVLTLALIVNVALGPRQHRSVRLLDAVLHLALVSLAAGHLTFTALDAVAAPEDSAPPVAAFMIVAAAMPLVGVPVAITLILLWPKFKPKLKRVFKWFFRSKAFAALGHRLHLTSLFHMHLFPSATIARELEQDGGSTLLEREVGLRWQSLVHSKLLADTRAQRGQTSASCLWMPPVLVDEGEGSELFTC